MDNIYQDICERTGGDIYVGVVGPVRSGKSTFISNFMEKLVLPEISDENERKRAIDELPQAADGKMIMTTQPKFVPNTAVKLTLGDKTNANVRLIDCVGFMIDGADGYSDGEKVRLVNTPWSQDPMTFDRAAEIGTQKVAAEHSTVIVAVTSDGTIGDIPRSSYVAAEEKTVRELKSIGKPFVLVVNSREPQSERTLGLCGVLAEKYDITVMSLDVLNAGGGQLEQVLKNILKEFPVRRLEFNLPDWMRALDKNNKIISALLERVKKGCTQINKMKDCDVMSKYFADCDFVDTFETKEIDAGKGIVNYEIVPENNLFFEVLSDEAGVDIQDEFSLMSFVASASFAKRQYESVKDAFEQADSVGYGIVYPNMEKMSLNEPEMVKQGSIYGVRLKASAPSYHVVRVDVATEVSPMVGTEQQSQYLLSEYKQNPSAIWNTNMFGKTMSGLAREGLEGKCNAMPVEIKEKLTKTIGKIVNENRGGLICLLL